MNVYFKDGKIHTEGINVAVLMKFGSHLYGTNTEDSDLDFMGVYIPSRTQVLLNNVPKVLTFHTGDDKSKNTSDDIDIKLYSLQYFVELACKGVTESLDMLHAPKEMCEIYTPLWERILKRRKKFYTRDLDAFVGYARKQAAKYGVKGSRLHDVNQVLESLKLYVQGGGRKLSEVWHLLPEGEHIEKDETSAPRQYIVCQRKLQETVNTTYAYNCVEKIYNDYGERAKQAKENKGIDWKAVSHALRAGYQIRELFQHKTITFPLEKRKYLLKVKSGKLDYLTQVAPVLEDLMEEVEALSKKCLLPKEVNKEYWDKFVYVNMYKEFVEETAFAHFCFTLRKCFNMIGFYTTSLSEVGKDKD